MFNILSSRVTGAIKLVLFLIIEVVLFFELNCLLDLITFPNFKTAFLLILLLVVINSLIWPVISYFSLKFLIFTLGIGTFIIDGVILLLLSSAFEGVSMIPLAFITVPFFIGIINSFLTIVFNYDEHEIYYRFVIKKRLDNKNGDENKNKGYIFLEIDGLAYDVLKQAIDQGDMPTIKSWIDNGTHNMCKWETDLSSQTSASQAGILHGNNNNIPAFRWVEKENDNKIVSSNGFSDAAVIEQRISDGEGLLSKNGVSVSNLFSGDAEEYILTFSKFTDKKAVNNKVWHYLFSEPYFAARIIFLTLWDFFLELLSRIFHVLKNITPRLPHRGLSYFVARAGANIVMREASTSAIIGDIITGDYDMVYTTYMGYDEIAHHTGIHDSDAFYALRQIDKQFKNIQNAIEHKNGDYDIIVLSDHGQSQGPTFKMKYNITLEQLVEKYLPENIKIHSILYSNDDHINENFSIRKKTEDSKEKFKQEHENFRKITEKFNSKKDQLLDKSFIKNTDPIIDRIEDLASGFGFDIDLKSNDEVVSIEDAQSIVLASGNLGLIYFTEWSNRMTYEQLEDAFPGLVKGIASHPGIGFVMVRSAIYGTVVLSDDNIYYMDTGTYDGDQFLNKYGPNITGHLKRTDNFKHVPDILVNSTYDTDTGEVYAFEELIGSHGGAGGTQQNPFIIYPKEWTYEKEIVGAQQVNKFFKNNITKKKK